MAKKSPDTEVPSSSVDSDEDLHINFKWNIYHPDQREYRNQSIEIEPIETYVQLDVPKGYGEITQEGRTVLSLAGLKYVIDFFDGLFLAKKLALDTEEFDTEDEFEEATKASGKDDFGAEFDEDFGDDGKGSDEKDWQEDKEEWE